MPPQLKTRDMPDARFWSAGLTARGECSATTPETSRQCKSIRSARMRAPDCSPSPGLGSSRQVPASQAVLYAGTQPKWYVDVGEPDSMPARENNEWSQDEAAAFGLILGVSRRQKFAGRPDRHGSRRQEPHSDGQACWPHHVSRARLLISRTRVAVCGGVRIPSLVSVCVGGIPYVRKPDRTWKMVFPAASQAIGFIPGAGTAAGGGRQTGCLEMSADPRVP